MNFVFDLYGTLADIWTDEERPELWSGVAELLSEDRERADAVRREYTELCIEAKQGEYHEIELLSVFEEMLYRRGLDKALAQPLATEFRRLSMVRLRTFRGVKTMLRQLRKKGGVYLLSNAQGCFTRGELDALLLTPLFDGIIISSDVGVKKPSPKVFEIAFRTFGISPADSIYVGNDMRDDILGAHSAGMRTAYIHTEQSGNYDMELPKPDYIAKNHSELKRILLSLA